MTQPGIWEEFQIETRPTDGFANPVFFFDVTERLRQRVPQGVANGVMHVFVPHTTCTLIMNSGIDGTTLHDIRMHIEQQVPTSGPFVHLHDGPQDASAHVRIQYGVNSLTLPVVDGHLDINISQGLYILELDGPRTRTVKFVTQGFN